MRQPRFDYFFGQAIEGLCSQWALDPDNTERIDLLVATAKAIADKACEKYSKVIEV